MTDDTGVRFLDEELDELKARVVELFGDTAVREAVQRARVRVPLKSPGTSIVDWIVAYRAAVRTELLRMVTPQ
jgi:hypothetical protein